MYQIVLTGPESTGKSTLAQALASHYNTAWVPEYARDFIEQLNRPYVESDLLHIAKKQQAHIEKATLSQSSFLFVDTAMLVMKIWSMFKYQRCHPWIATQLTSAPADLYVLCGTDIPWAYDPQREHPHQRDELLHLYRQELTQLALPFIEVSGNVSERLQQVIAVLDTEFD